MNNYIHDIREQFTILYENNSFVIDKTGVKTIEIIGASFIADEDYIFGKTNDNYIKRELEWYESQSLYVDDIPGKTPAIWKQVASNKGMINSNYGWCVFSEENGSQYNHVLKELKSNPDSRRATMIYNRPSMHTDYNKDGMSDFMCCQTNSFFIRNGMLEVVVNFRSNDAWAGFRNDLAWIRYLSTKLANDLEVPLGDIFWNAASLHLYESQFYLLDHYYHTGETSINKEDFYNIDPEYKGILSCQQ